MNKRDVVNFFAGASALLAIGLAALVLAKVQKGYGFTDVTPDRSAHIFSVILLGKPGTLPGSQTPGWQINKNQIGNQSDCTLGNGSISIKTIGSKSTVSYIIDQVVLSQGKTLNVDVTFLLSPPDILNRPLQGVTVNAYADLIFPVTSATTITSKPLTLNPTAINGAIVVERCY